MIIRKQFSEQLTQALRRSRVVAIIGPRQCGKTTLARQVVQVAAENYFDLEDPVSLARLDEPRIALEGLKGCVVIDEVQRKPDLFSVLRVLVDRTPLPARFLILGSASPELLRQSSETLAGRIEYLELCGFSLNEVGTPNLQNLWVKGGFPLAFLAEDSDSFAWRKAFIQTFLERDIPMLGYKIPSIRLGRFWTMLAHYHGQLWNSAELARSLGVNENTTRHYLDLLTATFMVRQLHPWHENIGKRQVKSPKVYIRDSGLFHNLVGISNYSELLTHPKLGASWEGWGIEEIIKQNNPDECYFWATHSGAELDLLLIKKGKRYGVEVKFADAPQLTKSMRIAMDDLKLECLKVVYPGSVTYELAPGVETVPVHACGGILN